MSNPIRIVVMVCMLLLSGQLLASARIAVVYPEAREPLRDVFRSILQGIQSKTEIDSFQLLKDSPPERLQQWLAERQPSRVIALGRQAASSVQQWTPADSMVIGAIRVPQQAGVGVSLVLQPKQLFSKLNLLRPQVKRVHVVYLQSSSDWLMQIARQDAAALGLTLELYPVADLRAAIARYVQLLPTLTAEQDALWLPLDEVAQDQQVVLPMVLKAAWEQRFAVFSDNLSQVERGVLFALYPDEVALGQRLATLAGQTKPKRQIELLQDVRWALNTRTATHLGVALSESLRRQIHLNFPAP